LALARPERAVSDALVTARDASTDLSSRVPAAAAGNRLVDYLARRFRYLDAAAWIAEAAAGRLTIDGRPARATDLVRGGATVTWRRLPTPEPFVDDHVPVLHVDDTIVVVDKPAHLPMHADGAFVRNTLVAILRERLPAPEPSLVHRLDRETSGVCVLARTTAARQALTRQFHEGTVRKVYHALVRGHVKAPFRLDLPIGRSRTSAIALRRAAGALAGDDAQPACTDFTPVAHGDGCTLLRCEPHTGRTHQIRVHLEANGTPILGDKLYGRPDADYLAFVARVKRDHDARAVPKGEPDRQLLHASELEFEHPTSGERRLHRAPLPAALRAFVPAMDAPC